MNPNKVGIGKFWAWQSRGISLAANYIMFMYLTIYCTDTLGIDAALVGTLLLASKVFDGVTDVFAGYLVDNTNTRWGKARPYELAIIGVWFCTWLLYSCPAEASTFVKGLWIFLLYAATNSIFATLLNTNGTPYMVRAFKTKEQYTKINAFGGIVVTLGSMVVSVSFPIAMSAIATSPAGWSKLIAIYAIPLTLIGLLRFIFIKETNPVDVAVKNKIDMKELFTVLKTNKYVYPIAGVTMMSQFLTGINAGTYYFTYIVGDISLYSVLQMLSLPMMMIMVLFPFLIKKFSISQIISAGAFVGVIGGIIAFFAGSSMPLLMIAFICTGSAALAPAYLTSLMLVDCGSYNEWKGTSRMDGTMASINNFAGKLGNGIGAGLLGILLGAARYNGTRAVQSTDAIAMIRALYSLVPMVAWGLVIIIMRFYKLDKLVKQMDQENEGKRMSVDM